MSLPTESNTARPVAAGYDAKIEYGTDPTESLYLRLARGPGREQSNRTVPPKDAPNTAQNPEDMRPETGGVFSRSDFTGGEGLDRAHRPDGEPGDVTRYWDSRNVDITPGRAGNPDELTLLKAVANIRADDAGNTRMPLVAIGTTLYMCCSDDNLVDRTANPTTASPTFTTEDPHNGEGATDIRDLAVLGDLLYVALAAQGVHRRAAGSDSWAHWSDVAAVRVWGVKGRIIASTGAALYEARATTTSVLLKTLPSGQTWTDVVDAGGAILAGASDGTMTAFVDEDGELVERQTYEFPGEQITALGATRGLLFIGTGEATTAGGKIGRLWRAVLTGLRLQRAEVLREWGTGSATLDHSPQRIINTREAIYTGVIDSATESHLWKYHLATAGISRDLILPDGLVQGLAVVDDRLFATVFVEGLIREATTYATSGYIISPLADFLNAADKTWIDARLNTGTMPTDTDAVLAYSTNPDAITNSAHASWTTVISAGHEAANQGDLGPVYITETESRFIAGKLTLTPDGAAADTPVVHAFSFRGLPKPVEEEFQIPVNISDRLEIPGRRPQIADGTGQAILDKLHDIKGSSITYTDLRSNMVIVGQLHSISQPIQGSTRKGSDSVYALIAIRGQLQ